MDTYPIDDLENIEVADRAELEAGEAIACLLQQGDPDWGKVWTHCGTVTAVSDDGTLVVYEDKASTAARGTTQWLDPTDWIARWPE